MELVFFILATALLTSFFHIFLYNRPQRKRQQALLDQAEKERDVLKARVELNEMIPGITNPVFWERNLITGQIVYNYRYQSLFGYDLQTKAASISDNWESHIHPEDKERVTANIRMAIEGTGKTWTDEYRYLRKDGSIVHLFDRGTIFRDSAGRAYKMIGCMMDRAHHVLAEQKPHNSVFSTIYETDLLGIAFSSLNGRVLECNKAFLDMLGYSEEDLKAGKLNWQAIAGEKGSGTEGEWFCELGKSTSCAPCEQQYVRKDGSKIWVVVRAARAEDTRGEIITYIADISDKKLSEKKQAGFQNMMARQQAEFLQVFTNAPAMIIIWRGRELELEFANKAALAFLDKSSLAELTLEDQSRLYNFSTSHQALEHVFSTGQSYHAKAVKFSVDRKDGGEKDDYWFDHVLEPVFDAAGNIDGVTSFAFDVTELVRAHNEIKHREEKFRFLADSIPHKLWTADEQGEIQYFNKEWFDYTGSSSFGEMPSNILKIVHPDDKKRVKRVLEGGLIAGREATMQNRYQNQQGEYRWHLCRLKPLRDESGDIRMWVTSSTDIHEQKITSEALQISEAHFRELANQNNILIWKADPWGAATYVNNSWEKFTGLSFEDSLGNGWLNALHPQDRDDAYKKFKTAIDAQRSFQLKFRVRKGDGKYRWMLNHGNPVVHSEFEGFIGTLTDIHDQELRRRSIHTLMKQKDEFLSVASHELKTPITSMKGALQIIDRMAAKNPNLGLVQGHLQIANKQVDKLIGLVEDLLDVSKIQAGKMQLNLQDFSFGDLLKECLAEFEISVKSHRVIVEGNPDVWMKADKFRIEQVLNNFLSNAVKYSPGCDSIVISCLVQEYHFTLSVSDFGIGIPEEKVDMIFDRFYRVQESANKFSGLGLGLFISKEIILRHGGEIGTRSNEGQGSTFWFKLPLDKQLGIDF